MQTKRPPIVHEVETKQKDRSNRMCLSKEANIHWFCIKKFGFMSNVEKPVEENMKKVIKHVMSAACFDDRNNTAHHALSINKEATS